MQFPPQHQDRQPGLEYVMEPVPTSECGKNCRKLENKVALMTGGDSGIGRAVAYDFVKEGGDCSPDKIPLPVTRGKGNPGGVA